ncbi:hypothetical protein [Dyadobacter frigoris]|uniref:Uncharacterized protein n=1 Tax=Dyadobacter frigoris TaxID=2576211 RepID=A0A4U6D7P7_9BACT|nr:hypothetical protein [Dyadobacter frigoris]TKT93432.1 hypothetical protein FDK13_06160 [Dyadobacter frigoris]GLU55845.1 hypothetical protein Dfri01_53060 [Dyadobacter frigoris]
MTIYSHWLKTINTKILPIVLLLIINTLQSCHNDKTEPINPYNYYPLKIGQFSIYEITEVVYSAGQKDPVISNWQEKDEINSVSTNSVGIPIYLISTSRRNNSNSYWQKVKQYNLDQYPDKIIQNIDNESIVPMIFPIDKSLNWNGYMYLNLNTTDNRYGYNFKYENVGESFDTGLSNFEKTLKVVERVDTSGLTKYNFASKHYANGVGLILDQQADFDYLQINGELSGYKVISSGKRRIKRLVEYSKN